MRRPVNECFGVRILAVSFLVLISGFTGVGAQAYLKPGFDAEEYRDLLRIAFMEHGGKSDTARGAADSGRSAGGRVDSGRGEVAWSATERPRMRAPLH
jgi:hypothetical protein